MHFDARMQNVVRVGELQLPFAAAKHLGEDNAIIIIDLLETFNKDFSHLHGQLAYEGQQLVLGDFHVLHLGVQELVPLADLLVLLDGVHVDTAQSPDFALQLAQPAVGRRRIRNGLGRRLRLGAGQLVFLVQPAHHVVHILLDGAALFLQTRRLAARQLPLLGLFPRLLAQLGLHGFPFGAPGRQGLYLRAGRRRLFPERFGLPVFLSDPLLQRLVGLGQGGDLRLERDLVPGRVLTARVQIAYGPLQGLYLLIIGHYLQLYFGDFGRQLLPLGGQLLPASAGGLQLGLQGRFPFRCLGRLGRGSRRGALAFLRPLVQGGDFGGGFLRRTAAGLLLLGQTAHLALQTDAILLCRGQLASGAGEICLGGGRFLLQLPEQLPGLPRLFAQNGGLLLDAFNFRPAGQQPGPLGTRAAGHGAARVDHLSIQGHDAEAVAVFARNGHGVIQILRHGGAAQQAAGHSLVGGIVGHQGGRQPDEARLVFQAPLAEQIALDRRQGQESGPSSLVLLQIGDSPLGVVLFFAHQVLGRAPQGGLHRQGIVGLRPDQPGYRPQDAPQDAPLRLLDHRLDAVGEALHVAFQLFQQPGPAHLLLRVQPQLVGVLLGRVQLGRPGIVPQLVALGRVLQLLHPLPAGVQRLLGLGQLRLGRVPGLGTQGHAGRQLGKPDGDFRQGGLAGHRFDPDIRQPHGQG